MIQNLEGEIWKDVLGWEGLYQVSNLGRVKSVARQVPAKGGSTRFNKELLLKATINQGYHKAKFYRHGPSKNYSVHRVVMEAFVGRKEGLVIDHINHNKLDNRLENLRYCTMLENSTIFKQSHRKLHMGVEYNKKLNKYIAVFGYLRKRYRGKFKETEQEAIEDFKKLWLEIKGYEFNPLGFPEKLALYPKKIEATS